MTPEQIEKLRAQADAYANAYGQYHAWDSSFDRQAVRDTEFARLVEADALERAAHYVEAGYRYYSIAAGIRALRAEAEK